MKRIITRRSKVGFGYNAGCSEHWNEAMTHSWLAPDETEKPDYTGTILQVLKAISEDRTLASFRSGGTYYTTAWFVKADGKWHRLTSAEENSYQMDRLATKYENSFGDEVYGADFVDVETDD